MSFMLSCGAPSHEDKVEKAHDAPTIVLDEEGASFSMDSILIAPEGVEVPENADITKSKTVEFDDSDSIPEKGTLTYNYEDTMMVGKSQVIELRIRKGVYLSDKVDSVLKREVVQVSSKMRFTLDSDDPEAFGVKSYSTDVQIVDSTQWTVWKWLVRANKHGEYFLNLKGVVTNGYGSRDIPIFHKRIVVVAKPKTVWYLQHTIPENVSEGDFVDVDILITKEHKVGRYKLRADGATEFELRLKPSNLVIAENTTQSIFLTGNNDKHISFGFKVENPKNVVSELYATNTKNTTRVFKQKINVHKSLWYRFNKIVVNWKTLSGIFTVLFIPTFLYFRKVRIVRKKLLMAAHQLDVMRTLDNKQLSQHIVETVKVRLDYLKAETRSSAIKSRVDIVKLMLERIDNMEDVDAEDVQIQSHIDWFKNKAKFLIFAIIL